MTSKVNATGSHTTRQNAWVQGACSRRAGAHARHYCQGRARAVIAIKRSRAAGLSRHVSAKPSATRWKP